MLTDAELLRLRIARHNYAEEVLTSVVNNEPLMRQVRESAEYFGQGGKGIPHEEVVKKWRERRGE